MEKLIKLAEKPYLKPDLETIDFSVGDTVNAHLKVVEGDKVRIQIFSGIIISIRGFGLGKTIKIRKISYGVGVEKTLLLHSPILDRIEIVKPGHPRRAKLFYLRKRVGKKALKVRNKLALGSANPSTGGPKKQLDSKKKQPDDPTPPSKEVIAEKETVASENNPTTTEKK